MDPDRAIPFFQPSDPRLKTAYSYGDPRGGSYPDPSELFAENIEPDGIEHSEYIDDADEIDSDDGNDSDSILITELAESTIPIDEGLRDSSFDEDDRDDRGEYDDVEFEEFPSSESDQGVYTTQRGRGTGRGRGRGSGRVRGSTHGRGVGRPRGTSRGALGSVQRRGRRTRPSIKNRTRRDTLDDDEPRRRPRKRKRKGPELSPEFKRLNGLVTQAWMVEDYDTALEHALEAVKLNPEVFPLHATIAEILDKKGRHQDAIGALFAGVHSSRDPKNWWYVVDRLNTLGEDDTEKRQKLGYCYSKLVLLDPNDYQAKLGRAKIYFQNGHHKRAKNDCETLLSKDPIDGVVIELYAKACMELDEPETALSRFEDFIKYCTATEPSDQTHLSWSLITSYVDILMQVEEYEKALIVSRRLTRWMLGRGVEKFWDDYDDDREWDPYPEPRRELVRNFRLGVFDEDTYGLGMPIEFRVRLGVLRILNSDSTNQCFEEGLSHLEYLFPSELQDDWQLEDYADLFKEAGDCLRETGHHSEALSFYEPLLATTEILDSRFYFDIAMCYQALGRQEDVRAAINHIRYGENNPMAQIGLAKLYRAQGRIDLMWRLCIELRKRNLHDLLWKEGLPVTRPRDISEGDEAAMEASVPKTGRANKLKHRPTTKYKTVTARKQAEQLRDVIVKAMYDELKDLEDPMKQGDSTASAEWMRIAAEMFEEFRAQSRFFPKDKSKPYMGEGWSNREIRMEMIDILNPKKIEFERPKEWRQIPLDEWAGLLSHYAICLANENNTTECWNVINTIEKATVIYPEPERYHLVRVASLRCAIILNDEEKTLDECRWFCKKYEHATDTFRLPSAASRALHGNPEAFRRGPEQKFWMRQLKIMDFSLLDEKSRNTFQFTDGNRVKWTENGKSDGNPYQLKELDPELYALYGHQMNVGGSPGTALNYYFRAYALKPNDPIINLCLGLAYISLAFKRQSPNRQFQLQQGLTFIMRYYESRCSREEVCFRQEAEYNIGVIWHSLGLVHLALPAYDQCIKLSACVREEENISQVRMEDFAYEAALAKRSILAMNGDLKGALKLSREWLVL